MVMKNANPVVKRGSAAPLPLLMLMLSSGLFACSSDQQQSPQPNPAASEVSGAPQVVLADQPAPVKPVDVSLQLFNDVDSAYLGELPHTHTWDGRVLIVKEDHEPIGKPTWVVKVLRPEALTRDERGAPKFVRGVTASYPGTPLWNPPDELVEQLGQMSLAAVPAPGVSPNPFRSGPDGIADPKGAFETYELWMAHDGVADSLGMQGNRARIVISNPRTPQADVHSAKLLDERKALRTLSGGYLEGIEPGITFDGRLIVWQGPSVGDIEGDEPAPVTFNAQLTYSYNPKPGAIEGWSEPKNIARMYYDDRDVMVDGVVFHERFPIAKQPLRGPEGEVFAPDDIYRGAYPWMSWDGSEITHTGNTRFALTVIGRLTGYAPHRIDGAANPDRQTTPRLFFSSPGMAPGFWTPFRDARSVPIPYTAWRPVMPIIGSDIYTEVSFHVVRLGWGQSWGVYLSSPRPFRAVRRHFRSFLVVSNESGKKLYFRYYDPRVMRDFLPLCTRRQASVLFRHVDSFLFEDEQPSTLLELSLGDEGVARRAIALGGR